jgi:hypothetical protein
MNNRDEIEVGGAQDRADYAGRIARATVGRKSFAEGERSVPR